MFQSDHHEKYVALQRHEDYYINGGDLYFLVEHYQFRVHRYFFERESAFFRGKLTAPATPGASRQGADMASAIVLDGVRSGDFAKFLWVFYNPKYSLYKAPSEDWTAILDLAHRWGFAEVKALAVRELEHIYLPDIDKIVIYHKYDVDRQLLLPQYTALCLREKPLDLHEGLRLGLETTIMLTRARECARQPVQNGLRSPSTVHADGMEMESIVRDLFGLAGIELPPPPAATSYAPNGILAGANDSTPPRKDSGASAGGRTTPKPSANGSATAQSAKPTPPATTTTNGGPSITTNADTPNPNTASNPTKPPATTSAPSSKTDSNTTTSSNPTSNTGGTTTTTTDSTTNPSAATLPSLDTSAETLKPSEPAASRAAPTTNVPEVDQKSTKDTPEPSKTDIRKFGTVIGDNPNQAAGGESDHTASPASTTTGKAGRGKGSWLKRG